MERNDLIDALAETLPCAGRRSGHEHGGKNDDGGMTGKTLHKLYRSDGGMTPGELRDLLNVTGARVTAILKELEGKGLLTRDPGLADKRSVTVVLTDAGRADVEAHIARRRERAARVAERLGAEDAETLVRLLRAVREIDAEHEGEMRKR